MTKLEHKKRFKLYQILTVSLVLFVLFAPQVNAQSILGGLVEWTASTMIDPILNLFDSIASNLLAATGNLLSQILFVPVNTSVVQSAWELVRDFANMFFIIGLIVMAFSTIFGIGQGYDWKSMLARFLITAVLMNFSLVIGNLVVDASQIVTSSFLNSIGMAGNRVGQIFVNINPDTALDSSGRVKTFANINQTAGLPGSSTLSVAPVAGSEKAVENTVLVTKFFGIIMKFIIAFLLITPVLFAIVRIPMIWFLLTISPIAWTCNIFPGLRHNFRKWWQYFIAWNVFMPIFLFFLILGYSILINANGVIQNITASTSSTLWLSLQVIFFYVLITIILIGGTSIAFKTSLTAGMLGVAFGRRATNFAGIRIMGRPLGVTGAAEKRFEQFKQEGFKNRYLNKVYGGKEGRERAEAWVGSKIGVRGALGKSQKDLIDMTDRELKEIKEKETAGKLKIDQKFIGDAMKTDPMSPKGIAMRSLLYERGMGNDDMFKNDIKKWAIQNPFLAEHMIEQAQKGGFKGIKAQTILEAASAQGDFADLGTRASANTSRQKMFEALIGGKDIEGLDIALNSMNRTQVRQGMDILGSRVDTATGKRVDSQRAAKFKKSLSEKRADVVGQYESDVDPAHRRSMFFIYKDSIRNKGAADIAKQSLQTWRDPEFQQAVRQKIAILDRLEPYIPRGSQLVPLNIVNNPALMATVVRAGATPLRRTGGGWYFAPTDILPGHGQTLPRPTQRDITSGGGTLREALYREMRNTPNKLRYIP